MKKRYGLVLIAGLALAGCGGAASENEGAALSEEAALKNAATTYATTFLAGKGAELRGLMSERCQGMISLDRAIRMGDLAGVEYAKARITATKIEKLEAGRDGQQARAVVSHESTAPDLEVTRNWIKEITGWKWDGC